MNRITAGGLAGLVLLGLLSGGAAAHPPVAASAHPSVVVDNISVRTTSSFRFVPNQVTVTPGATVHLVVTQAANFAHSFVLSRVANFTIPGSDPAAQLSAFFNAHSPLVNLSIPGTVEAQGVQDFTAPAAGTYEFVYLVSGHFQGGMFGFLAPTTIPGGASSSSSGFPISPLVLGAVVGVVVVVVAVLVARRRSRGTPPQTPGSS
jgi:uncharacterized cupredoxin-like copper-binding protein